MKCEFHDTQNRNRGGFGSACSRFTLVIVHWKPIRVLMYIFLKGCWDGSAGSETFRVKGFGNCTSLIRFGLLVRFVGIPFLFLPAGVSLLAC